jgi:hypothetical protein
MGPMISGASAQRPRGESPRRPAVADPGPVQVGGPADLAEVPVAYWVASADTSRGPAPSAPFHASEAPRANPPPAPIEEVAPATILGTMGLIKHADGRGEWVLYSTDPQSIYFALRLPYHPLVRVQSGNAGGTVAQVWISLSDAIPSSIVGAFFDAWLGRMPREKFLAITFLSLVESAAGRH